jgi:aspartate 1-decarboxylase
MISYGVMDETESKSYIPRVVHVDGDNRIVELGGDPAAPSPGVLGQVRGDIVAGVPGDTVARVHGDTMAG